MADPARFIALEAGASRALAAGFQILTGRGSALDAVLATVRALEDEPAFNAGVGAVLTRTGTVELDASVMDGRDLRFGAVAAVPNLRRPVDLARLVMDDGEHGLLCADGAWAFAREHDIHPVLAQELITAASERMLERERARREGGILAPSAELSDPLEVPGGTVGACAIDHLGNVAAATSTGGMCFKRPGRIGDTPICGAGTFADDRGGAASATGHGERIMKFRTTAHLVGLLRSGIAAPLAAWAALDAQMEDFGGETGIISVDREGRVGVAHNSPHMTFGVARLGGSSRVGTRLERGVIL